MNVLSMAIIGAGVLLTALLTTQVFSIVLTNTYAKQRLPRSQG